MRVIHQGPRADGVPRPHFGERVLPQDENGTRNVSSFFHYFREFLCPFNIVQCLLKGTKNVLCMPFQGPVSRVILIGS